MGGERITIANVARAAGQGSSAFSASQTPPEPARLRSWGIQARLAVSRPGDVHEQEADDLADQVLEKPAPAAPSGCPSCAAGGTTCPSCRKKEDDEPIKRKAGVGPAVASARDVGADFVRGLGSGQPLASSTR